MPRLRREEYRLIREFMTDMCGLVLDPDSIQTVERRLADRLMDLQLSSYSDYYHYLRYHPRHQAEQERAIDALTTNETYFFRELPQLRAFSGEILPDVHTRWAERKTLNVWSAGCSTGEEVYTLAILISESGLFHDWDVRVFGNDISRRVLQTARAASYRAASFRALPSGYDHYFLNDGDNRIVVPRIRALCHFGHFNLLDDARVAIVGKVDVIFCRNVLIYLDSESRRRLIGSFFERLLPGGYLMLGHSESLLNSSTAFELAHLRGDLAYRRPEVTARRHRDGGLG